MPYRTIIIAVPALILCLGCAGAEKTAEHDSQPVAEQVVVDTTAGTVAAMPSALDLAGFPMPDTLMGEDHVVEVGHTTKYVQPAQGTSFRFRYEGDDVVVNISSLTVNCCTESFRAAVDIVDGALTLRLYEYLPDVCECTHPRDIWVTLKDVGQVESLTIFLNDAKDPLQQPDC